MGTGTTRLSFEKILLPFIVALGVWRIFTYPTPLLSSWQSIFDLLVKPLVIIYFLLVSAQPKKIQLGAGALIGVFFSFVCPLFLKQTRIALPFPVLLTAGANGLFYATILLWGYFSLGRNLGIFPALRDITTKGPYRLVRHPLYSCYFHICGTFLLVYPSWLNFLATAGTFFGLGQRITEEEKTLIADPEYQNYREEIQSRLFHPLLSFPLAILLFFTLISCNKTPHATIGRPFRMQFAYPVLSLDPRIYDDWGSVFVGNHIYPRLIPDEANEPQLSVAESVDLSCAEPSATAVQATCKKVRIRLSVRTLQDCLGRSITPEVITKELGMLLRAKTWILPGWNFCPAAAGQICIEAKNVEDIQRRMQNLYFRFGWSLAKDSDQTFGGGPFCLSNLKRSGNSITDGLMRPLTGNAWGHLPTTEFFTSSEKTASFSAALYGAESLLSGTRKNIQAHTPLAYYVISNPNLEGQSLPWNNRGTRDLFFQYLLANHTLQQENPLLVNLVPSGNALIANTGRRKQLETSYLLMLPDYLSDCKVIAASLTNLWRNEGWKKASAQCVDTNVYITETVQKKLDWQAFVTPLSPGAPGKNAIQYQYFSSDSAEGFSGASKHPQENYYLIGLGQSLVTVDGVSICGLRPNSMGLGNVFVSDFLPCQNN